MRRSINRRLRKEWLPAGIFLCMVLGVTQGFGAQYGRVSGKVTDTSGNPLMGATVLLTGPGIDKPNGLLAGSIDRVFTDAHGNFIIDRVTPGWYSLQVISPARLPVFRSRVEVKPGTTTREAFALGDILSGFRWQSSKRDSHAWEREWKWILRTSGSTRPILRYNKTAKGTKPAVRNTSLPSRHLVAMMPGSSGSNGLSEDPGMNTIVAYLRPLDENSDVLVAGSVSKGNLDGSSVVADYRRGLSKRDQEEISLAVHQLSLDGNGIPVSASDGQDTPVSRGMILRYTQTRQLSDALTLTAGFEMRYLDSISHAGTVNPEIDLAYQLDPSTVLNLSFGGNSTGQPGTLLHRVGDLDAFPRITLNGFRPRLENVRHAEVRIDRSLGPRSGIEIAAYHDGFQNVAVWGVGGIQALKNSSAAGNILISPSGNRAVLNAGDFGSSGAQVTYERSLWRHTELGVMYAFGNALAARGSGQSARSVAFNPANLPDYLRSELTQTVSGKFSTVVPHLKTRVITTYGWLPAGRITIVDPYGQARMDFQPFWGLQLRQPLPKIDILPLQIVAIADFRNLLGQGSVSLPEANGGSLVLTPAYRTVRGGFAVQF